MVASASAFLLASQNPDSGWGYAAGQASIVEATATSVLALRDELTGDSARRASLAWLGAVQHADGGWGLGASDPQSGWPTAWGVLALAQDEAAADAVHRGAAWLLAVKTLRLEGDGLQREVREKFAIDPNLRGWPWLPGEASWVEPTSLAMLALTASSATAAAQERLAEGARYLVDRRCHGGGWNFGNPVMLGGQLPPRAHPTAWALLALARVARDAIQPEDLAALRAEMRRDGGALALAWGLLALRVLGEDDAEATNRLSAQQRADGSWNGNPFHTAVALLAERGRL
ncbi:MAG: hypothetical protein NT169_23890 [Chloroflexi bacterium]|nr:hypothetical protein [Chloroflexota bacterium]